MNRDTAEVREKAVRLFTYVKELTQLRTAMVRDLSPTNQFCGSTMFLASQVASLSRGAPSARRLRHG